jgi:hypothetical protein
MVYSAYSWKNSPYLWSKTGQVSVPVGIKQGCRDLQLVLTHTLSQYERPPMLFIILKKSGTL